MKLKHKLTAFAAALSVLLASVISSSAATAATAAAVAADSENVGLSDVFIDEIEDADGEEDILVSETDEGLEDGQNPAYRPPQISTLALSLGNLASGTTKFGVKIPVHSTALQNYDKYIGIDVSKWNGDIDWAKVKAAGIDYAIIRVGYRGYGAAGTLQLDDKFFTNIKNAQKNDIKVGVYFFTQAISKAEAIEEANFVIKNVKNYTLDMPIVIDIEDAMVSPGETGRVTDAKLTRAQLTNICKYFCDTVEAAGYDSMIYANKNWFYNILYKDQLEDKYNIWLAHYINDKMNQTDYTGKYQYWQYSSTGTVPGITTDVDLDMIYSATPPDPPVISGTVKNDQVTLSWKAVENVDGYAVFKLEESGGTVTYTQLDQTTSLSYKVPAKSYTAGAVNTYAVKAYRVSDGLKLYSHLSNDFTVEAGNPAVSGLKASSANASGFTVTWTAYANASKYEVYICESGDDIYKLKQTVTKNTVALTGLSTYTDYDVKIRAVLNDTTAAYSPFSETLIAKTGKPPKPDALTLVSADNSSITISWNKCTGASGYRLYKYNYDKNAYQMVTDVTATSYKFTGLEAMTTYTLAVKPYIMVGDDQIFSSYTSGDFTTAPPVPTGVKLKEYDNTSITLSWNKVEGASGYRVYKFDNDKNAFVYFKDVAGALAKLSGLEPGTSYRIAIRSYFKVGDEKIFSATHTGGTFYTRSKAPTGVKLDAADGSSVTLSWNKANDAAGYRVYKFDADKDAFVAVKDITATSYKFTELSANTSYRLAVRSYIVVNGEKVFSPTHSGGTFSTTVSAPTGVTLKTCDTSSVTLSWNKSEGAAGYRVYKYDEDKNAFVYFKDVAGALANITGLKPGTSYRLAIRSYIIVDGEKVFSPTHSGGTFSTATKPPAGVKLDAADGSSVTLSWNAAEGAAGYRVYKFDPDKNAFVAIKDITETSYKFTELSANTSYRLAIRSYTVINGAKVFSPTHSGGTFSTTVTAPTGVKAAMANSNSLVMTWNKSEGAAGYRIYKFDEEKNAFVALKDVTSNTCTVDGLSSATSYRIAVRSYIVVDGAKVFSPTHSGGTYSTTA